MKGDLRSFSMVMVELEFASLMTLARVAHRFADVTLSYAERSGHALVDGVQARTQSTQPAREPVAMKLATAYGDYLRELAALSGWASMNFLNQLDLARAGRK